MRPTAPRRLPLVAEQSGWREYFYPETLEHADGVVQGTLRNLLGERDDERLTALGRFTMRWSAVTPRQWSTACAHAMPAPGTMRTRPGELRPALEQIIQPRDATTSSTRASRIPTLVMPPPDQRCPGPTRGTPPAAGPPGPGARRTGRGPTL